MLSPEYLDNLPDPVVQLFQDVEDDILRDMARRISKMDGLTDTASYQAWGLEQTQLIHKEIVTRLSKMSGKTQTEISDEVGISQAQVSRLEKSAINTIRNDISYDF